METVVGRNVGRASAAPALLTALLALLLPAPARAAPAPQETQRAEPAAAPPAPPAEEEAPHWSWPPLRLGGLLSYDLRQDRAEQQQRMQHAVAVTLNAATNTYLWEPWFARVDGNVGVTVSRENSKVEQMDRQQSQSDANNASRSAILTGSLRLSVLAQSRYPFEAHIDRNSSKVATDVALATGYSTARVGFTQHYLRPEGDTMLGWDHSTQDSDLNGRDRQDSVQLSVTHALETQRLQLNGDAARNTHEASGESALQENLMLQHSYTPDPALSLESMANLSSSAYHLRQGDNRTDLAQLSSMVLWRPEERPLTVTGGVRLFALGIDTSGKALDSGVMSARARNFNANLGASYDWSDAARLYASANQNVLINAGQRASNASESVGASYTPATHIMGPTHYSWSTSAVGVNRSGGAEAGQQLTLQLSHNLGRSVRLGPDASLSADFSQGVTAVGLTNKTAAGVQTTRQLSNGASLSWDVGGERGASMVRLSASDARSLDGRKEFFQMVNLQASSALSTGNYSSWNGSLTVQAVRQGYASAAGVAAVQAQSGKSFTPTSTAAVTYQQQRLFNVRNLRYSSDLRLNGQTLFPVLGSTQDQETAAWENRLDYMLGRMRLRVNVLVARSNSIYSNSLPGVAGNADPHARKSSRSVAFSLSRAFGNF
jgi:hypothetical protein